MENEAYTCGVAFVYILFFHTELNLNVNCILNTYECLFLCHRLLFTKNKHGENKMIHLKHIHPYVCHPFEHWSSIFHALSVTLIPLAKQVACT